MYWKKPELTDENTFASAPDIVEPQDPASAWDVAKSTFEESWRNYSSFGFAKEYNFSDAYEERNKRVKEVTGQDLFNPAWTYGDWMDADTKARATADFETYRADGGDLGWAHYLRDRWSEQEWRRRAEKAIEKHPELKDEILAPITFEERGKQLAQESTERAADVWARSDKGFGAWAGYLGGGFASQVYDPTFYLSLPLTFGGASVGAKGLMMGAAKAAGINMAAQAIAEPSIAAYQQELGNQYGLPEAMKNIGFAGAFGAGFDLAGRGAFRTVARGMGFEPVTRDGIVVAWRKPEERGAPSPELPAIAADLEERARAGEEAAQAELLKQYGIDDGIPDATLQRAEAGDATAMAQLFERQAEADPVLRQTVEAAIADEQLAVKPLPDIPDADHAATMTQTLRAVADPEHEPLPRVVATEPIPDGNYTKLQREVETLRGKLETADNRADIEAQIAGLQSQIRMIDTFGRDPVGDALKLRENPGLLTRDFDLEAPKVKQVRSLARLSDEAFAMVKEGKVKPALGALVADFVEPALQTRALTDLAARKPVSPEDARANLAELLRSPDYAPPVKSDATRLLDDPYGKEAKAQTEALEQKFREELAAEGRAPEPDPIAAVATPEGQTASIARAAEVDRIIEEMTGIAPKNTIIRRFDSLDDLPPTLRARVRSDNAKLFADALDRFQKAASQDERLATAGTMQAAKRGEGIEGIADGDTIWIAAFAQNPKSRIAHEVVHALRNAGQITDPEIDVLVKAARDAGVFSKKREALYRDAYRDNPNLEEYIRQEAAAHYMEAVIRNELPTEAPPQVQARGIVDRIVEFLSQVREALGLKGFRPKADDTPVDPARDVINAILTGEVAKREMAAGQMRDVPAAGRIEQTAREDMRQQAENGVTLPDGTKVNGVLLYALADEKGKGKGIKAFHGSPHDFDAFDLSRIGTGEGAQAYGHGLYFSATEKVARGYRDRLSRRDSAFSAIDEKYMREAVAWLRGGRVGDVSNGAMVQINDAISDFAYDYVNGPRTNVPESEIADYIEAAYAPRGVLYEVNIRANPEDFLDWDKPLSQQPEAVRNALAKYDPGTYAQTGGDYDPLEPGQLAYMRFGDQAKATQALRDAGILGIKYLDGMSRRAGEGSSNYVVFDDALIEIVAKNGVPIKKPDPLFAFRDEPTTHDPAHVTAKDKGAGVYVSARVGKTGYGYTADGEPLLMDANPARLMQWGNDNQTPEVRRAMDAVALENGITPNPKGATFYRALVRKLGDEDKASQALRDAGIQGHTETMDGFQNSVLYDESLLRPDPLAQGTAPQPTPALADAFRPEYLIPEGMDVERNAEGIIEYVRQGAQRFAVTRDAQGQITALVEAAQTVSPEVIDRLRPILDQYGIDLDQAMPLVQRALRGENVTADVLSLAQRVDPQQAADLLARAQEQMTPAPDQPLYAMRNEEGRMKRGAERRAKALAQDLNQIEADLAATAIGQREGLQRKRATFLNAQAEETGLDDLLTYRTPRGQEDVATAFLRMHESVGVHGAPFMDLRSQREIIAREAIGMMDEVMWELRKGAITGDLRRVKNKAVRTRMENMIREAAGENTGDATAKSMGQAWLKAADYLRQRFNAAGGDIAKLKGWFAPQYHDPERILRVGRQEWVDYLMKDGVLDRDRMRTFDGAPMNDGDLRNLLRDIWDTITTDGANKRDPADGFGKGALYKRHAEHRVLHFKNADAYLAYAKDFGGGDPYAMMIGHIQMMARDIAALERFGANPEVVRERLKQQIIIDSKTARSARSVYDDLTDLVSDLKRQVRGIESPLDAAMKRLAELHKRLDEIRGKPRFAAEREALQADLFKANEALHKALKPSAVNPQAVALVQRIVAVADEMDEIARTHSVLARNPEERARRILTRADEMWKLYMGHTNVPVDGVIAGGLSGLRNWISSSMLIFAPMSAVTDQATSAAARAFIGMPVAKQLGSFVKAFTKEDRKFALRAMVGLDSSMQAFATSQRFMGFVNTAHVTGYIADRTHAFSGLAPMTQAAKIAFSSDFMAWMADLAQSKTWTTLEPWTRQMMERHGFTQADFTALKSVTPDMHRGVPRMTRPAIERTAGADTADRFMRMMLREQAMAVLEPTMQGRTAIIAETKPGTVIGEMARSVAMLKSFPTSYMMLILGRFYNQWLAGRAFSGNTIAAGAAILVGGTLLGALAMQMKSLAKGQDPQPMDNKDFWIKAFFQSGGLGIYGDFVANTINRQGGSLAQTIFGPLATEGQALLNLTLGNLVQFAQDEKTNAGRELTQYIRQRTPGAFVPWYIRTAYERMVLDELQKMVDPEAHKAFRRRIKNQKKLGGNDFYWRPGQAAPDRGPNLGAALEGRQ